MMRSAWTWLLNPTIEGLVHSCNRVLWTVQRRARVRRVRPGSSMESARAFTQALAEPCGHVFWRGTIRFDAPVDWCVGRSPDVATCLAFCWWVGPAGRLVRLWAGRGTEGEVWRERAVPCRCLVSVGNATGPCVYCLVNTVPPLSPLLVNTAADGERHPGLFKALTEDPLDPLPRLAFADWLDERGEDGTPYREAVRLRGDVLSGNFPPSPGQVFGKEE